MPRTPRTARDLMDQLARVGPVRVGAVAGVVVAAAVTNSVVTLLWLLVGAGVGAFVGAGAAQVLRQRRTEDATIDLRDHTRAELYERAKAEEIPGRSTMDKEQLAEAVAEAEQSDDPAGADRAR